ncbi:glycoside hydrolase family 3 C-terminal domain-containing protein [Bacteroides sp. 51]|uniref:glycoside hydrolase family 3 C-terminal domain-containing protein n=1 Tax=Bacteroides sp. 51 TaxID=2302938 RepID=UPI0013D6E27A|nr:glycoside hydrolase family 3 C-terminal domain-containing protein [Bacteroides sp. 51]NDV81054.1 hypothetical protein [Bacteroides sp. 51]
MRKINFTLLLLIASSFSVFAQNITFPSEQGIGQTWNRSLTKRIGQIVGQEARRGGQESIALPSFKYGDSPYLVAELGIEMSKGLHANCPVTDLETVQPSDVRYRAAFKRITEESGVLEQKTYDALTTATPVGLQQEQKDHKSVALQVCRESIVLLKNDGNILPVDNTKRILLSLSHYNNKKEKDKVLAGARKYDVITVVWDAEDAVKSESKIWLKVLSALGKPVVLVLSGEESFAIDPLIESSVSAVLAMWIPKQVNKELVTEVIRGGYSPGSRLTTAIYDTEGKVLYPFGHGLSYTTVTYSDLTLEPEDTEKGKNIIVRFKVTNTGKRTSDEVALLYVQKASASAKAEEIRMEGFKRTNLKPGETKEIKFTIRPRNLETFDQQMNASVTPGEYKVTLSGSGALQQSFTY